jgi:hypothetical protein
MTNQPISPFRRLRRPAGLIGWSRSYTTHGDTTAYCEEGFGPECPWGLVSSGEDESMGMDSGWFPTFMEAYFDSFACTTLPIWRVFKVEADGAKAPLTAEGDWDATWREVMRLRESDPSRRYDCGHSISVR